LALSQKYRDAIAKVRCPTADLWRVDFLVKYFFIFDYAAHETDFRWIVRAFDDMVPNLELLYPLMVELDKQYNPLKEVVVRGNCIVNGPVYLQGGAGTILSRAAFEMLAGHMEETLDHYQEIQRDNYDDIIFGWLLERLDIPLVTTQSTAFLGYEFEGSGKYAMRTGNFSVLPECPERLDQEGCRRYVAPVRNIVFHHGGTPGKRNLHFNEHLEQFKNLWSAPLDVQYYIGQHSFGWIPHMCRGTPSENPSAPFVHP
jgi:hypothetical protein